MRLVWLLVGCLALGLAIVGAVLPLLPTTPFLLVAAYAFARSSPRLESWLLDHAHFGPLIRDWRAGGTIARPVKRTALAVMAATLALSWALGVGPLILTLQIVALAGAATFVASRPEPAYAPPFESDSGQAPTPGDD